MDTLTTSTALELIEANEGDTITVLRARMVIEGYGAKVINEAIAEAKAAGTLENKSRSAGFAASFYDFLTESTRTKDEAIAFINDETSDNVKKHETHYLAIWELAENVRIEVEERLVDLAA